MSDRIRKTIDATDVYPAIDCMARKEKRDFSTMCSILLHEAIHARQTKKGVVPLPDIFKSLPFTGSSGLVEIIKKSLSVLSSQIFNQKNPASRFIQGWDTAKLAAISGISEERLLEIAEGSQITPEEAISLMHIGMDDLEFAPTVVKKEGEATNGSTKYE